MREIKFRAWLKEKKVMAEFISHLKHAPDCGVFEITVPFDESGLQTFRKLHSIDQFDLMQFTGLTDKNGKEIYEGDVIEFWSYTSEDGTRIDPERYAVTWMGAFSYPAFDLDVCDRESNMLSELVASGEWVWEVIGNIYDNPNLLV